MESTLAHTDRRTRGWTRAAAVAVWVVLGLAFIGAVLEVITISTGRVLFTFGGAEGRLPLEHLPQLLQADLRDGQEGYLVDVPVWLRLLCAGATIVQAVTIAAAAVLVVGIIRKVSAGRPFDSAVVRRFNLLALMLVGGGIIQGAVDAAAVGSLWEIASSVGREDSFMAPYWGIGVNVPQVPFLTILLGVIAAALSVAFRAGKRLEEETTGIV